MRSEAGSRASDRALRRRAERVVPGGLWGHQSASRLPEGYPQFFADGRAGRVRDVDGNEYVDFMCSYGPIILGHGDPDVEEAARAAGGDGAIFNGPAPVAVELAELLVETLPHADWAMFQKNGTDATTTCVTIARAATGRRKILVARGAYHGAAPWCTPSLKGVTAEDRAHLLHYEFNDLESLGRAVDEAGEDLAGIIVSAFRHDVRRDQEMANPAFAAAVRRACDRAGAALILDEVRAGFRLDMRGSWEGLGVRPDLSAWSKGIANGRALAAVTGAEALRDAAARIFVTGSFWCAPAPMAAALATLRRLRETDAIARMEALGRAFRDGLAAQAAGLGIGVRQTGPAQMPMILFDDDPDLRKGEAFAARALAGGIYLHPWHNMFLCAAHTEEDVAQALAATALALEAVAAMKEATG